MFDLLIREELYHTCSHGQLANSYNTVICVCAWGLFVRYQVAKKGN